MSEPGEQRPTRVRTGFWAAWRASLRVSRREARRAKGRSALVVAMIALPVVGLAFFAATYDMFRLTPAEQTTRDMGQATAWVAWQVNGQIEQARPTEFDITNMRDRATPASHTGADVLAALPAGSRAIERVQGTVSMRTATGVGDLPVLGLDVADPLTRGMASVLRGRAPHGPGEVALSESALGRLGTRIGRQIAQADGQHTYTVVGVVEVPDSLRDLMVFTPEAAPGVESSLSVTYSAGVPPTTWLVKTPSTVSLDQVHRLNAIGMQVISRAVRLDPPPMPRPDQGQTSTLSMGGVVVGVALLEIILLAGPAFAVGARRRQHDLALVAANGGTPAHLRRLVLADGVLLGLAAGVLGVLVGAVGAVAGRPLVEAHMMHARAGGYRFYPTALLAITGLAILTGVLAALVPAFTAARQDVVVALAGRRGAVRSRKRWLVAGLALCGLGTLVAGYGAARVSADLIVGGLAVGELGLALCTPSLVGLVSRAGRLLPAAPRIALRDTARNRAAAAPAISAVMAAVAACLVIGVFLQSSHERDVDSYTQTLPTGYAMVSGGDDQHPMNTEKAAAVLRATLPVRQTAVLEHTTCPTALAGPYACDIELALPAGQACPYRPYQDSLSKAQVQAVGRDPRCAGDNWQDETLGGAAVVDGAGAISTLTGAQPDDVATAAAVLDAGGVVVPNAKYLVDGEATVTATFMHAEPDPAASSAGAAPTPPPAGGSPTPQPTTGTARANPTPTPSAPSSSPAPSPSGGNPAPASASSSPAPARPPVTLKVPGYVLTSSANTTRGQWIVSHALLTRLGMRATPTDVVAATTRMPSQAEQDKLRAATDALAGGHFADAANGAYFAEVERGPSRSAGPIVFILALVAGAIALGAASIATGLAAADGRADLATLAAVGAAPRVRRLLSLSQSGVIAGLGSLLGSVAGLGSGFAVLIALNRPWADVWPSADPLPLAVPWLSLGIVLLAVPAVAMLSAGMLTRSRLPIEARRPT